ncbi:hypothetical protein IMX12_13405 [Streptomyces sp. Babs14]|uniref:hypothetical protein n=1 Tax=unclassified Streptomyces TaxID=2593676 RepID=UPI001C223E29|nr:MULTISPECIES: hypothetical protein [unclassified Streptomyces]MBU8549806.1 hypothetical protein [Streptomyces sp. Osf17]MBU8556589.1 hypothetical protein [Streptomyces sp. Babs14]
MSQPDDASLAAARASGYCWLPFGPRGLHCTRSPGHNGDCYDIFDADTLRALALAEDSATRAQKRRPRG